MASKRRIQEESSSRSEEVDADSPAASDNYQVFFSYCVDDTRKTFMDHLYHELTEQDVRTFIDNEDLPKRRDIKIGIDHAIMYSEVLIPIISKSYVTSARCLDELSVICRQTNKLIIPVFYHVDPSNVIEQKGLFEESFRVHETHFEKERVKTWREAMTAIGKRAGHYVNETTPEGSIVRFIVKEVIKQHHERYADLEEYTVGMDSRLQDVTALLDEGSNQEVLMIGICGMAGLGKTTIAKTVYNKLCHKFDFKCFLGNVRERASVFNGLISLQKQLIFASPGESWGINIFNISQGTERIKLCLRNKRVLLILDDLNEEEQLTALAGDLNWFGRGSRVIVTTRDKRVLFPLIINQDKIYEPPELDSCDSLKLFSLHAFGKEAPENGYEEISKNIVSMMHGLPLALKVVGSDIFNQSRKECWEEMTKKLKEAPHPDVEKCLRITFDELDENEKMIFLDVACLFVGKDASEAIYMWEACGFYPLIAMKRLQDKSLLKVDDTGRFQMHDILRVMARHIVSSESQQNSGGSRIWNQNEALNILKKSDQRSDSVEGIIMDRDKRNKTLLQTSNFPSLSSLRILSLDGVDLEGDLNYFPRNLKQLDWRQSHLKEIPGEIVLEAAVLSFQYGALQKLWAEKMVLRNLRILNLEGCNSLKRLPHPSSMPNLGRLILRGCTSLKKIPNIRRNFRKLEVLDMTNCQALKSLPEDFGEMASLEVLILDGTGIEELPTTFEHFIKLKLFYWRPDSKTVVVESLLGALTFLKKLIDFRLGEIGDFVLKPCYILKSLPQLRILHFENLKEEERVEYSKYRMFEEKTDDIASNTSPAPFLEEMIIGGGGGRPRPVLDALPNLPSLLKLEIRDVETSREIWELQTDGGYSTLSPTPYLEELQLSSCSRIEALPNLPSLKRLSVSGCEHLEKLWEPAYAPSNLELLEVVACEKFSWTEEHRRHLPKLKELKIDQSFQNY